ncbi:hypothetical protein Aperf_G00000000510 [Anoplocephala perfoliata]
MDEKSSVTLSVRKRSDIRIEKRCKPTATDYLKYYLKNRLHMSFGAILSMYPSKRKADSPVVGLQARKRLNGSASCSSTDDLNFYKALKNNNSNDEPSKSTTTSSVTNASEHFSVTTAAPSVATSGEHSYSQVSITTTALPVATDVGPSYPSATAAPHVPWGIRQTYLLGGYSTAASSATGGSGKSYSLPGYGRAAPRVPGGIPQTYPSYGYPTAAPHVPRIIPQTYSSGGYPAAAPRVPGGIPQIYPSGGYPTAAPREPGGIPQTYPSGGYPTAAPHVPRIIPQTHPSGGYPTAVSSAAGESGQFYGSGGYSAAAPFVTGGILQTSPFVEYPTTVLHMPGGIPRTYPFGGYPTAAPRVPGGIPQIYPSGGYPTAAPREPGGIPQTYPSGGYPTAVPHVPGGFLLIYPPFGYLTAVSSAAGGSGQFYSSGGYSAAAPFVTGGSEQISQPIEYPAAASFAIEESGRSHSSSGYSSEGSSAAGESGRSYSLPRNGKATPPATRSSGHSFRQIRPVKSPTPSGSQSLEAGQPLMQFEAVSLTITELSPHLLNEEVRSQNFYPMPGLRPGRAAIEVPRNKYSVDGVFICSRCRKTFTEFAGVCVFHSGKRNVIQGPPGRETKVFSCCGSANVKMGCETRDFHVHDFNKYNDLDNYVTPGPPKPNRTDNNIFAVDCEMIYTHKGFELGRVSVVSTEGAVVYDKIVRPSSAILDPNTMYSGLTEEQLMASKTTLNEVQQHLLTLFDAETILIGHSLECDLTALKIIHDNVIDTAVLFISEEFPNKRSLALLASTYLGREIQTSLQGHNSVEDAKTCLSLVKYVVHQCHCGKWPPDESISY